MLFFADAFFTEDANILSKHHALPESGGLDHIYGGPIPSGLIGNKKQNRTSFNNPEIGKFRRLIRRLEAYVYRTDLAFAPSTPGKRPIFLAISQETPLKGFQFGTLTVDGYELLTYFSILRRETGLMYL